MFDALLDDELLVPAAAALADPALQAAAKPLPRPRQGGVLQHSELSTCRIKLSWANRKRHQLHASTNRLVRGNFTTFSEHASAVSFGRKSPEDKKVLMLAGGGNLSQVQSKHGNRSKDVQVCKFYGCLAAAVGQASGLKVF